MAPYFLIPLVAAIGGVWYVLFTDASRWSKLVVVALFVLSVVLQRGPSLTVPWAAGMVLQTALGIFFILAHRLGV